MGRRPVIATDAGGTPETIDNGVNGIAGPPRDIGATPRALIELTENGENENIIQDLIHEKKTV